MGSIDMFGSLYIYICISDKWKIDRYTYIHVSIHMYIYMYVHIDVTYI